MKLTILGSSSALPTSERNPAAHVLSVHERFYLIDCGEGTQLQLRRHKIPFSKINHIFISHLHGDHVFGIYGLLSTLSLMGRKSPLNLYAPESYGPMIISHLADFDIHLNFELRFRPLAGNDPALILDEKHLTVTSIPLRHRIPSFGFIFREKEGERKIIREMIEKHRIPVSKMRSLKKGEDLLRDDGTIVSNSDLTIAPPKPLSYAYCSDTSYFKRLAEFVKGVDLLYHEATFDKEKEKLARMTGHSTTIDAARVAADAKAGALILGHFSARYRSADRLVEEARTVFRNTIAAVDGSTYKAGETFPV